MKERDENQIKNQKWGTWRLGFSVCENSFISILENEIKSRVLVLGLEEEGKKKREERRLMI